MEYVLTWAEQADGTLLATDALNLPAYLIEIAGSRWIATHLDPDRSEFIAEGYVHNRKRSILLAQAVCAADYDWQIADAREAEASRDWPTPARTGGDDD